jgi:ABC-type multidrug transport system fused ATPase/permease subunit
MQTLELNKESDLELFPALKAGFWKRQFQDQSTKKQNIFDWIFGVVLPTACCLFDPLVFKGAMSRNGAILGEYKPFAYSISFISIILMMLFLLFGRKLKWFNGILAGLFLVGTAISLIVGVVIFPLSLIGLIILIGMLGFTPLFAAFVYFRNSIRAISFAETTTKDFLLFNLAAVSAIFSFVLPYVFYVNIETSLREMENGNAAVIRENKEKLQYFAPFINIDRLGLKACGEINESKKELRSAIQELSGMNDEKINRQYCNDW